MKSMKILLHNFFNMPKQCTKPSILFMAGNQNTIYINVKSLREFY